MVLSIKNELHPVRAKQKAFYRSIVSIYFARKRDFKTHRFRNHHNTKGNFICLFVTSYLFLHNSKLIVLQLIMIKNYTIVLSVFLNLFVCSKTRTMRARCVFLIAPRRDVSINHFLAIKFSTKLRVVLHHVINHVAFTLIARCTSHRLKMIFRHARIFNANKHIVHIVNVI